MSLRRRPFARFTILALCAVSFNSVEPASAQSTDNSPLQMLQSLTPDQRDAIMNQLGIGGGGNGGGASGGGGLGGVLGGLGQQGSPGDRQRQIEQMQQQGEVDQERARDQQKKIDE